MNEIQIKNLSLALPEIAADAFQKKHEILKAFKALESVTELDEFTESLMVDALAEGSSFSNAFDKSRLVEKRVILGLGKQLDDMSDGFISEVDAKVAWAKKLLQAREMKKRQIAAQAEADRQAALQRALNEKKRLEDEKRAEEERANKALIEAQTPKQAVAVVAQMQATNAAIDQKIQEAQSQVIAQVTTPTIIPKKVEGARVADVPKFEVTDIHELYKVRPELVRLEPATGAINTAIKGGMLTCAGLKIWMEVDVGARKR